ncbi:MAG: C10 family peptidase [Muribaculaceae bacterium]|nr:C10 family peptidase [Muribaculaceae bacterium]
MYKIVKAMLPFSLIFSGCSSYNEMPEDAGIVPNEEYDRVENILEKVSRMYGMIYKDKKHYTKESVTTIEPLEFHDTRGGTCVSPDLYIVNYGDNEGFAVLSNADERDDIVLYAISDEGSLHLGDTVSNKGLSWYINIFLPQLCSEGNEVKRVNQANKRAIEKDTAMTGKLEWVQTKTVLSEPILGKNLSLFHQRYPFNTYCYTLTGDHALTGCAPLAVGTVLSHYQWPLSLNGYSFNWSEMMANRYDDDWYRLFEVLGRSEYLNASYGINATGVIPSNVIPTFSKIGYSGAKKEYFRSDILNSQLKDGNPMLCYGYANNLDDNTVSGHIWIIDGGYLITATSYLDGVVCGSENLEYYHCVWGFDGVGNGYFLYGGSSLGGSADVYDEWSYGVVRNYTDLSIIYGFKPQR